jgi:hypothetical protein
MNFRGRNNMAGHEEYKPTYSQLLEWWGKQKNLREEILNLESDIQHLRRKLIKNGIDVDKYVKVCGECYKEKEKCLKGRNHIRGFYKYFTRYELNKMAGGNNT